MDIRDLEEVADVLRNKRTNEINLELQQYHVLAGMIGSAFVGKLSKKPPQIKTDDDTNDNSRYSRMKAWALSLKKGV